MVLFTLSLNHVFLLEMQQVDTLSIYHCYFLLLSMVLSFFPPDSETGSQMAIAKISKMTMYVVCVLHKVFDFPVPKSGTEIKVSEEGYDCKIKFEDGAFENGDARVKLKVFCNSVNFFTNLRLF